MAIEPDRIPPFTAKFPELPPTRLVLIRNASQIETDPVRLDDHDDLKTPTALSDAGRAQAERICSRFHATGELTNVSALLASNARRAIETAEAIAPALGVPITNSSCGFCEPHSGQCTGMPIDEWSATLGRERAANWSPFAPKSPGGEAVRVAIDRAARALIESVLTYQGTTVVVVTHTTPLRASLWTFLGLPFHGLYAYPQFTYGGITEWLVDGWMPDTGQMRASLVRYNDTAHLMSGAWAS